MNVIKISVLKNRLSGILSVGPPSFSVVSGILSVGNPNISVISGILSVVGIPPVPIPIPEKIQLLMYDCTVKVSFLARDHDLSYRTVPLRTVTVI